MDLVLRKVDYATLNARQKENYNFHQVSAILAEYGFSTLRLTDDWAGADFIAIHIGGEILQIQLKSRMAFAKKYLGKRLYICCRRPEGGCYLYPHDELLAKVGELNHVVTTESWTKAGGYSFAWSWLPSELRNLLEEYKLDPVMATPKPSEEQPDEA